MPELLQKVGLRSYRIARRSGLLSWEWRGRCYSRAYLFYKKHSEAPQTALIKRLVQPGTLAIDVGANIGYFTMIMARAVGSAGAVLAFEPEPYNVKLLRMTVRRNHLENAVIVPSALGDHGGRTALWVNADHPADHRMFPFKGHAGEYEVDIVTLDEFMVDRGDTRGVSVVKIDVQGAELSVLRGMHGTLVRHASAHVLLEIAPDHLTEGGTSFGEVRDFLAALGFSPFLVAACGSVRLESWDGVEALARRIGYVDVLLSRSIPTDLVAV